VKFLVDNQLPASLAKYLRKRGFDCQHVLEVGLGEAVDEVLRDYAGVQERIIISKDEDFLYFAKWPESKVRLIWVRLGNCRTPALLAAFERSWPNIEACLKAGDSIIEIR
jgi:predicted nuclease of predicted toxin-antitoxin system